jgi:4-amino-4-deoxy-L-arabinose transferase-like glycosyltransferase
VEPDVKMASASLGAMTPRGLSERPDRRVLAIVGAGLAIRMALAALAPLTTDEAYYVDWARHLAPGYLDHPPLVAWLIAGPLRLFGHHALAVRLPAVLLQAGTTLLAASLARALADGTAARNRGVAVAVMLQAAPVFSLGALLMTPDAPLAFAWAGALWALERGVRDGGGVGPAQRGGARWWLALGLFLGVGALSKLHAGLLGIAVAAALLATRDGRRALASPWPWAAAALALVLASPMLMWNAARGWPTFAFQAQHGMRGRSLSLLRFLASVGGQLAYVSPLLLAAAVAPAWRGLRAGMDVGAARLALAFSALPVVAFFTVSAALTPGALPHWTAPAWLSAMVLLAAAGSRRLRPAVALGFAMSAVLVVALPLAPRFVGTPLDELRGWKGVVEAARRIDPEARLATTHWMALGHLGWYAEEPLAYVSDRRSGASFYPPDQPAGGAADRRPLLIIAPEGLGPDRRKLEEIAGSLEERGRFTASYGGRAIRSYHFYTPVTSAPLGAHRATPGPGPGAIPLP